jgi:hypothetical protein
MPGRTKREWAVLVGLAVAGIVVARLAPEFYDKVVVSAVVLGFAGVVVWRLWRDRSTRARRGRTGQPRTEQDGRFRKWGPGDG